jgi:hypothetical protein
MTSYVNSSFNFRYVAPSGWSFNTPDVGSSGISITSTNSSYPVNVHVYVFDRGSEDAAKFFAKADCFDMISIAYSSSDITSPLVPYLADTFYVDAFYGISWIKIKYKSDWGSLAANYNMYNQRFVISVWYFTTTNDHSLNNNSYFQHVLGANFISLTPIVSYNKVFSSVPILSVGDGYVSMNCVQQRVKLEMYDILGRRVSKLYQGSVDRSVKIQLDPRNASNAYFIQMKSDHDSRSVNSIRLK